MSHLQLGSPVKSHVDVRPARATDGQRETASTLFQCVIVTGNRSWGDRIVCDAAREGWDARLLEQPAEANRAIALHRVPLVIVRLLPQSASEGQQYRTFTESLARSTYETLLVVCTEESDPGDELWARQLGAWTYLPGVDLESDIGLVCREAKVVVEKKARVEAVPW